MNVYSDDQHTAINLLAERAPTLPACVLMTGDFNCHSREWDPSVPHHRTTAISLLNTAARLGLELTLPVNPGPTFLSHNVELRGSVIDLVFIKASESLVQPRWLLALSGPLLCMACMSPFFNSNCILVSTELITQRLL